MKGYLREVEVRHDAVQGALHDTAPQRRNALRQQRLRPARTSVLHFVCLVFEKNNHGHVFTHKQRLCADPEYS